MYDEITKRREELMAELREIQGKYQQMTGMVQQYERKMVQLEGGILTLDGLLKDQQKELPMNIMPKKEEMNDMGETEGFGQAKAESEQNKG